MKCGFCKEPIVPGSVFFRIACGTSRNVYACSMEHGAGIFTMMVGMRDGADSPEQARAIVPPEFHFLYRD